MKIFSPLARCQGRFAPARCAPGTLSRTAAEGVCIPISSAARRVRLAVFVAALLVLAPGCYRRVSYISPEGRQVELVNLGFDTSIGSLHAETPSGSLRLENVDSQA